MKIKGWEIDFGFNKFNKSEGSFDLFSFNWETGYSYCFVIFNFIIAISKVYEELQQPENYEVLERIVFKTKKEKKND